MDTQDDVEDLPLVMAELHASKDGYEARLRVNYSWSDDGKRFSCHAHEYWATNNGRSNGNISLGFLSGMGVWSRELTGQALQFGAWNLVAGGGEISANADSALITFTFVYDRAGTSDVELFASITVNYKPPTPTIDSHQNFVGTTFNVTGGRGITGATLILDSGAGTIGIGDVPSGGRWSVPVPVTYDQMSRIVQAYQKIGLRYSDRSGYVTGLRGRITAPAPSTVKVPNGLVFKGIAASGTTIKVVSDTDHSEQWGTPVSVGDSQVWEMPLTKIPLSGLLSISAQLGPGLPNLFTEAVSFYVLGLPTISRLLPVTEQDSSFTLEGSNGLRSSLIQVFRDQGTESYGSSTVTQENGNWSVSVTGLPPGPVSLVAEQFSGPLPSGRSVPRLFKIRPPILERPTIVFPNDTSVKFSGKGHYDPARPTRIQFIVESGQGTAPPVAIVKADGTWETTATGWELGTRTLVVTQQIADSPSGWIDSLPFEFTVNKVLPDITDVQYTQDYQPTFTGQGFNGATVQLRKPNSGDFEAPPAEVAGGHWSSTASTVWGPSFERQVHIKQYLRNQSSPTWFVLKVTIPPLAPGVDAPPEEGLSPTFSGSCWPRALVKIKFSDSEAIFDATVTEDVWSFKRPDPFTGGVTYTIEAIQTAAGQSSEPASRTFSVYRELLQPVIKTPLPDEETDSDLTVTGDNGLSGASMQLWDARDNKSLGSPVILVEDGLWSIALSGLAVDRWYISAQQTLNNRPSEHSDVREFNVVVMPPEFCNPLPDSDLPRTSTLSGKGRPGALVTVWCEGLAEPLLRDVLIGPNGFWDGSVTLAVGDKVIWANQTFEGKTSKPSPEVSCRFVPHAVLPESPTPQEHLGNAVTVSGFAVPGDQITLMRGATELGQTPVLADGSWSITATLEPPDGAVTLSTVASCGEFPSAPSEWVSQVGLYLPAFTKPEAGHWVSPMVTFTGLGNPGVGKLMAWYNPDVVLAASVTVTAAGWMARSTEPLAGGAQWCRFEQTFSTGTPISDCSESGRFDVGGETSGDS